MKISLAGGLLNSRSSPLDNVPKAMRERKQWVLHRNKRPVQPDGSPARVNDPSTWLTFKEARIWFEKVGGFDGIGYVLIEGDGIVAIDIDNCRNPDTGELSDFAQRIINQFPSYREISLSGGGLHIFLRGEIPEEYLTTSVTGRKNSQLGIEVYRSGRFIAMTGDVFDEDHRELADCQEQLAELMAECIPPQAPPPRLESDGEFLPAIQLSCKEICPRVEEEDQELWAGNLDAYDGDHSRADLALVRKIVFYTGDNEELIDEVFSASGLYRDKWDRPDYQHRTVRSALASTTELFGGTVDEPDFTPIERKDTDGNGETRPAIVSLSELVAAAVPMALPVIDGLLRPGETANVIAAAKKGKSFLLYGLILCIVTGRSWLGRFPTHRGRALLVDNELHPATIRTRLQAVAATMGLQSSDYLDQIDILSLRGRLMDVNRLGSIVKTIPPGRYSIISLDAWYRLYPKGVSENDNAAVAGLFNRVDRYAAATDSSWLLVHHASKGSQADKSVVDVGAGAGSQARAADAHIILREHAETDHVVLDAAVRSFPPVKPAVLRWEYPLWHMVDDLDPGQLSSPQAKQQAQRDEQGAHEILTILDQMAGATVSDLRKHSPLGRERIERLLLQLKTDGKVTFQPIERRGNHCNLWSKSDVGGR